MLLGYGLSRLTDRSDRHKNLLLKLLTAVLSDYLDYVSRFLFCFFSLIFCSDISRSTNKSYLHIASCRILLTYMLMEER